MFKYSVWTEYDGCVNRKLAEYDSREDCLAFMRLQWKRENRNGWTLALMDNTTGRLCSFIL